MMTLANESIAAGCAKCVSLILCACLPSACIIVSTPNAGISSFVRYAWVVAICVCGEQLFRRIAAIGTSVVINDLAIGYLAFVLLQCCNLLAITRLDESDLASANIFQTSDSFFFKSSRAFCLIFNLRGIGTPWQSKRLNKFPRFFGGRPTRTWYVLRQSLIIAWQYLFLDIVYTSSLETPQEDTERLFGHGKEFLYLSATPEQWAARVGVSIISWLGPGRVTIDMAYRGVSGLSVLLGIRQPEDWPPLFGSIWDAYTIRGCWSTFWHQSFRWPLTSISNFICRNVLGISQPSRWSRYLNVSIVFFVSGFAHLALDSFSPQPPPMAPSLAFFSCFSIAILIEEVVQELWRRIASANNNRGRSVDSVPVWHKLVGYVWVVFWLAITSPWFLYPATRLSPECKWLVPWSVVRFVGLPAGNAILVAGGLMLKVAVGGEI